jgi:proton-translocating NADH-quinone oxidoreductase chain L
MVTIIAGCVHFYSMGYMKDDISIGRFISYLSLFTFFMFILVTGDNFIQLFLGWEGIGLCSYLLISFWNTRIQANKSAIKALILNRIGDFGFICGLVLIFYFFRTVDFATVFILTPFFSNIYFIMFGFEFSSLDTICFFLFLGSMGKSAQIGLHIWLPDAMEGPTPVSALIHAATLVTAGVFLIIRCSPLFELAPFTLFFILFIGGITAFFAATVAITQDDIKKVIAYSTCSQLGYMVFICGLSSYNTAIFHLINHAFFKALLFLGAGSVIHALSGEQDMRKYGKLIKLIPYTYNMLFIGCLALIGFPFLSGFYSKDLILELAFSKYSINGIFLHWLGSLSACLTAFYSFRLLHVTFWEINNSFRYCIENSHELPKPMGFSLGILCIGSLFCGFFLKESFVGFGTNFWGNSIYISNAHSIGWDFEYIPIIITNTPFFFSLTGLFIAIYWKKIFGQKQNSNKPFLIVFPQKISKIIWFFNNKWYFDYVYNYYFGYTLLFHSYETFYKLIDKGLIEICGPQGFNLIVYNLYNLNSKKQLGYIYHMACLLFLGLIILINVFI